MTLHEQIRAANRVYIVGNGGSYANAAHIANDLLACGIKASTIDAATLTAFANDHGYENALAIWLSVVAEEGDLLIALSGSGTSPNILRACEAAEHRGATVHRVYGALIGLNMQEAEEDQLSIGHNFMRDSKR